LGGDEQGYIDWIDVTTGVTDIMDRTFDLSISGSTLSVKPYASKKLLDPGFAYFYLTGNTTEKIPTYTNPLVLDGTLNSTALNVYSTGITAVLSSEINTNPTGWTVDGVRTTNNGDGGYTIISGVTTAYLESPSFTAVLGKRYIITWKLDGSNNLFNNPYIYLSGNTSYVNNTPQNYVVYGVDLKSNWNGTTRVRISIAWGGNSGSALVVISNISIKTLEDSYLPVLRHYTSGITYSAITEMRGNYDLYSIGIGKDSIGYITTSSGNTSFGKYNTAFGYQSLKNVTLGYNNIAFGYNSLYSLTTGYQNIGIGDGSLYTATEAYDNISIGYSSMNKLTTAIHNISIGNSSMDSLTTGTYNIGIGTRTLSVLTTSSYNIGIGYNALVSANASYNIAIGHNTLNYSTSGTGDVAIGYASQVSNKSGNYNTSIGHTSLYSNLSGSYNTAVGTDSIRSSLSNYNVGVGYQVGYGSGFVTNNPSDNVITSDTGMTLIGSYASKCNPNTLENSIAIGYSSEVMDSNATFIGNYYTSKTTLAGNTELYNYYDLGPEVLNNSGLTEGTYWSSTGDLKLTGNTALYSGLTSVYASLTQNSSDFLTPVKGDRWYRISLSITISGYNPVIKISGSTFSSFERYLSNNGPVGTKVIYFKTTSSPGNFTISTSVASLNYGVGMPTQFTIDNISIKEVLGGDLFVNRKITGYGPTVRYQLDPTVTGSTSTAYFFDTENVITDTGLTLLAIKNSGTTKFDVKSDGNVEIPLGQFIYHRQVFGTDTDGDFREGVIGGAFKIQKLITGSWTDAPP